MIELRNIRIADPRYLHYTRARPDFSRRQLPNSAGTPLVPCERFRKKSGNSNGVLSRFDGSCSDDLSCWFRLEHGRLLRKRIDALTFFRRGLLDNHELGKARKEKGAALLQFPVPHAYEGFEDALDVPFAQSFVFGSNFFNQLGFGYHGNSLRVLLHIRNFSRTGTAGGRALHKFLFEPRISISLASIAKR